MISLEERVALPGIAFLKWELGSRTSSDSLSLRSILLWILCRISLFTTWCVWLWLAKYITSHSLQDTCIGTEKDIRAEEQRYLIVFTHKYILIIIYLSQKTAPDLRVHKNAGFQHQPPPRVITGSLSEMKQKVSHPNHNGFKCENPPTTFLEARVKVLPSTGGRNLRSRGNWNNSYFEGSYLQHLVGVLN